MIGAGVIGASIARELAAAGVGVIMMDQAPGPGGGCSYANASIVAPAHVGPLATPALIREAPLQMLRQPPAVRLKPTPDLVPWLGRLLASSAPQRSKLAQQRLRELAETSTELHVELAARGLNPSLRKTGAIEVDTRRPRRGEVGLLDAQQVQEIQPGLTGVQAGNHELEEWVVEPRSYTRAMLDDAVRCGADVRFDTNVHGLLVNDHGVTGVQTSAGKIYADRVILAAGLHSRALANGVGLSLPVRGGRGYVIDLEAAPGLLTMPVRLKHQRIVITPLADRIRVCGSIEFGNEARPRQLGHADDLLAAAARVLPALKTMPVIDRWSGERPCLPDGIPAIGQSRLHPRLYVATGHGMWGLTLAPITAHLAGRSIVQRLSEPAHEWLSPDRFTHAKDHGSQQKNYARL